MEKAPILLVGPTGGLSGVDQTFRVLATQLAATHEVYAVLPPNAAIRPAIERAGGSVIESRYISWWFPPEFVDGDIGVAVDRSRSSTHFLTDLAKRIQPRVILSNTTVCLDGLVAARIVGIPHIAHLHAPFVDNIYRRMSAEMKRAVYEFLGSQGSFIVTPSATIADRLRHEHGIAEERVIAVPNGIDATYFHNPTPRRKLHGPAKFLTLGHLNENKNLHLLVEVAELLRNRLPEGFVFRIVGPAERDYRSRLETLVRARGLVGHFAIGAPTSDVRSELWDADVYVNCSTTETFPISILEGMAAGLPVVSTPTDGGKEIVAEGITGFVAQGAEAIAERLHALASSDDLRTEMSLAAVRRVSDRYSVKQFVDGFQNVISVAMSSPSSSEPWLGHLFVSRPPNVVLADDAPTSIPRVAVVVPDRSQTSFELLINKPFSFLAGEGKLTFTVFSGQETVQIDPKNFECLYVLRAYVGIESLIDRFQAASKPVVFESDDNYFALRWQNGEPVHGQTENEPLRRVVEKANQVIVYSRAMDDAVSSLNSRHVMLPTYQLVAPERAASSSDRRRVIGFVGSLKRDLDFEFLVPALDRVLANYQDVSLEFCGYVPEALASSSRVNVHSFDPDYDQFLRHLWAADWCVGLAPLADTVFNRSKTNNKYREYAGAGIPGVYSSIPPYEGSVRHGETGLLVQNSAEAWYAGISRLLEDPKLACSIAEAARTDMLANYQFATHVDKKHEVLLSTISLSRLGQTSTMTEAAAPRCLWLPGAQSEPFRKVRSKDINGLPFVAVTTGSMYGSAYEFNVLVDTKWETPGATIGIETTVEGRVSDQLVWPLTGSGLRMMKLPAGRGVRLSPNSEVRVFVRDVMGECRIGGVMEGWRHWRPVIGAVIGDSN